ncbi:cytochrome P450 [Chaetomium strumarium]|uniref:Cytochrome P450 n=1 Tax=Chaetomium strumarium TaxID=1170767 RepID=A0AAJ0LZY2_9PEZI|nr:cytochrome P450 [Chaetomium strumarium]
MVEHPWTIWRAGRAASLLFALALAATVLLYLVRNRRRIYGLWYLVRGPQVIDNAYAKAEGKAFKVATPSNDHLLVTSDDLIRELIDAPIQQLSLHAVAKEILQPKYTMYGFEWQDQRGVEGTGFVRALRSLLTAHLPYFQPTLQRIIENSFSRELEHPGADEMGSTENSGFAQVQLFPFIKKIVTEVNSFIFFGEELSRNAEFRQAALEFPQTVVFAAELLRITPIKALRPLVAAVATQQHRAAKTLFRHLEPIVKRRLAARAELQSDGSGRTAENTNKDCMQWLIDTSPRKNPWSPARMVGEIMAVWFGSVHQLAMTTTYAIYDMCVHPEYVEPLRSELQRLQHNASGLDKLPLLDSFIKESIRCNNSDATTEDSDTVTGRRKALAPYIFQDGSRLREGDWACVPQRAMMMDGLRYSHADTFDGFRFARANEALRQGITPDEVPDRAPSSLTDSTIDWPIWGFGNTACPGRFYASLVLKLILVHILEEWECVMPDPSAPRCRTWRSSIVPRSTTVVSFRRQQGHRGEVVR